MPVLRWKLDHLLDHIHGASKFKCLTSDPFETFETFRNRDAVDHTPLKDLMLALAKLNLVRHLEMFLSRRVQVM